MTRNMLKQIAREGMRRHRHAFSPFTPSAQVFFCPSFLPATFPSLYLPNLSPLSFSRRHSSQFASNNEPVLNGKRHRSFKPLRPCVDFSPEASSYLAGLIENGPPGSEGIMVRYAHSAMGQPRMIFSLSFVDREGIEKEDEVRGRPKLCNQYL